MVLQRGFELNLNTVTIDPGLPAIQAHADIYDFRLPPSFFLTCFTVFLRWVSTPFLTQLICSLGLLGPPQNASLIDCERWLIEGE